MPEAPQIELVFARHAGALVLFARQWLDRAAAEDVVQDVFVRLIGQPNPPDNVQGWLFRAVRNAAIDQARAGSRRAGREEHTARGRRDWFEPGLEDRMDAQSAQVALEALPIEQREVVVMRIWGQMRLADIAQVTGQAVSTVFARYRAALKAVRQIMESPCTKKKMMRRGPTTPSGCSSGG